MGGRGVNWQHRREACEHRQAGQVSSVSFILVLDGWMWMNFVRSPHICDCKQSRLGTKM